MAKTRRKHANDHVRIIIEPQRTSENVAIGAERAAPQTIADYHYRSKTERVVLRSKQPSNLRRRAQHGKIIGMDGDELEPLRLSSAGHIQASPTDCAHVLEDSGTSSQVLKFRYGRWNIFKANARVIDGYFDELTGVAEWERP